MNKIFTGVTVDTFDGFTPSFLIGGLKLLGLDFVEINKTVFQETELFASKIGKIQTGFHLPIISESGWDLSCPAFQKEIETLINNLNTWKDKLNIQHVVSHPIEYSKRHPNLETSKDFLIKNLEQIDLPVYIENTTIYSPETFQEFYIEMKSTLGKKVAGICFDAPHLFITGNDPVDFFNKMSDNIGTIHLSDCEKDKDRHLTFGKGVLPIQNILKQINHSNFSGYITLEIQPHSIQNLDPYINSYLQTIKAVNYTKYLKTRLRMIFLQPLIKRFIN